MQLTINISDEQARFLKQFAMNQRLGAKDNLATYKPLHLVQDLRPIKIHGVVTDECYDTQYYAVKTMNYYTSPEQLVKSECKISDVIPFREWLGDSKDPLQHYEVYFNNYGVEAEVVGLIKNYDTISYHFTLAEAKNYIKYQGHNLSNPRTFTVWPGYGNNGDYEPFWDLLMAIGTDLLHIND